MSRKVRLLLTSAGGLTGTYLIKHLRESLPEVELLGVDTNRNCPAATWLDHFCVVPRVSEENFESVLREFVECFKPELMIPVASHDVDYFSEKKDLWPVKMAIMDYAEHVKLHDKKNAYAVLREVGLDTPKEIAREAMTFPCVLKKRRDSGSKNTHILHSIEEYDFWAKHTPNYFLVEYLEGEEFTVDCLFNLEGKCLGANPRKRLKTIGGGVVATVNTPSEPIDAMIEKLEALGTIRGPVNFQYKKLASGRRVLFDFNTRLPSGGLPLSVQSGFDIPRMLIDLLLGKKVQPWHRSEEIAGLTMIRYYEEMFVRNVL